MANRIMDQAAHKPPALVEGSLRASGDGSPWWRVLLALALLCGVAQAQPSSQPRADFWVPDGPVYAVAETNGIIYVGGLFDYISPVSETGNAFDPASGFAQPDFPKFTGAIKAILNDNAGGWFVGGQFTSVGGSSVTNLVHIRADRTVDTNWAPNPDKAVLALATDGTRLFVGGSFTNIGGQFRSLLAALEPATGTVLAWRADCTTTFPKPSVNALAVSEGLLYAGGYFSFINGQVREHIGSVDAATGGVTSWFPNGYTGAEAGARVDALAVSGNIVYVGGTFASIGGAATLGPPRHFIAALDPTKNLTNSVLPWDPNANGPITAIAVTCDTVYVGGAFTHIGGQTRHHIAALDMVTGLATPWDPNANDDVLSVVLAGNVLYAGGKFSQIGGQARSFLAALDTASGQATVWNPRSDFGVAGMALSGGAIVAGGSLGWGGKLRKNAAAFSARTGKPLDWSPQVAGATTNSGAPSEGIYALAASSTTVYLGGPFIEIDGQPRNHLGAVDALTGALTTWNPNANGIIEALALSGSVVYAGGRFSSIGGAGRTNLAALNASTGLATIWNPRPNDKVKAILVNGSTVYAGGLFTQIGGLARNRLAALDASSGTVAAWNPNVNDQVSSLSILGSRLYLGGVFATVGGQARNRLAAVEISNASVTCWDPNARFVTPTGERAAAVNSLLALSNTVHAGGSFNLVAGQTRNALAAVPTNCPAAVTTWDPNLDNSVNALAFARDTLYAGGVFQAVGGSYRPNFVVFPPVGAPSIALQPLSQLVSNGQMALLQATATGQAPLSYQWQFNGTNISGANNPSLTIPSAQLSHVGEYTLVVTNALGLIHSRPATLTVLQPLVILAQPVSQTVAPGTTVTLSVMVTGAPPPIYQWRRNGVNIPGAVQSTLTLLSAQPTDGGSYEVVVANIGGAVSSDIASVVITSPPLSLADNFSARPLVTTGAGIGSGNNLGATNEAGEPNHAGIRGGRSVWVGWVAPASGIATFSTLGSTFDTLLAVYNGSSIAGLTNVAADEDRAGFYNSQVSFNAVAGRAYAVAVDGFSGATGNIVLNWNLDTSTVEFPRILNQPLSQVVASGQSATFAVDVASPTPVTYQWFFGCRPIAGATNRTLTIPNVQAGNVGGYRVIVANASTRIAESQVAELEIGPAGVLSRDKVEELDAGSAPAPFAPAGGSPGFISVSVGTIGVQLFNNLGASNQLGEPNHCGVLGGSSRYFDVRAQQSGVVVLDTLGSQIDTVLAVYYKTNLSRLSINLVACDNNGAADGIRSLTRFNATAGRDYRAFVDGVNAAQGAISFNWRMGLAPSFVFVPPVLQTNRLGSRVTLHAQVSGSFPATGFQWLWNGVVIAGATNAMLILDGLTSTNGGAYSVVAINDFGRTTNAVGVVTVEIPYLSVERAPTPRTIRLGITGSPTQVLLLEASSNLAIWSPLYTNPASTGVRYLDVPTTNSTGRFFRAGPWP